MRQSAVSFKNKSIALEGVVSTPDDLSKPYPGVVVCHPHPLFGGDMNNLVVMIICSALVEKGFATLRFNFRGVGNSQGSRTKGEKEPEDVRSALDFLSHWPGVDRRRLGLAGYSFGASTVLSGLDGYNGVRAFAFISPPLRTMKSSRVPKEKRAMLVIVGDRDKLVQASLLREATDTLPLPAEFHLVPEADHSWRGHEVEVGHEVAQFFARRLK